MIDESSIDDLAEYAIYTGYPVIFTEKETIRLPIQPCKSELRIIDISLKNLIEKLNRNGNIQNFIPLKISTVLTQNSQLIFNKIFSDDSNLDFLEAKDANIQLEICYDRLKKEKELKSKERLVNIFIQLLAKRTQLEMKSITSIISDIQKNFLSHSALRILLYAANKLTPIDEKLIAGTDDDHSDQLKKLIANHLQIGLMGDKNQTRIEKTMPYFLLTLICQYQDQQKKILNKKDDSQAQNEKLLEKEVEILCEMMRICMAKKMVDQLAQSVEASLIKKLQHGIVDNIIIKINKLNLENEIIIPIQDNNYQHCYYLAIRRHHNEIIFRIENLYLTGKEAKAAHLKQVKKQETYIFPAIPMIEPLIENDLKSASVEKIKKYLQEILWIKPNFNLAPYINYIHYFLIFVLQIVLTLKILWINCSRCPGCSRDRDLSCSSCSTPLTSLIIITQLLGNYAVKELLPENFLSLMKYCIEPTSIGYLDYKNFQQPKNSIMFLAHHEQKTNNCTHENYIGAMKNRLFCFFKEHDKKNSEEAEQDAEQFCRKYLRPHLYAATLI